MRVLACDPGYDRLGVAVLEKTGGKDALVYSACITTDRTQELADRLLAIGNEFVVLLKKFEPDYVALETLFFNKNQKTAIAVAETRGMLLYLAQKHGCTALEYSPQEIKIAVTGWGKSDKRQVMDMVKRLLPDVPKKALDDEYDAIAVGMTAIASVR
ncbi:crossover junction endodeoxyribonuclease RuvC [Candidatus Kaiserbacteria bacterium]|nr:crossover junction endodeoxyribonuclease RuvC [Candidatus Kaiserbacteria bacterium]